VSEIKKVLKDDLPSKIYLDTTFFVDVLIETISNKICHGKAFKFAERLKVSQTTVICSKLSFLEFWNAAFGIGLEDVCGNRNIESISGNEGLSDKVFVWTESQYKNLILFLETLTNRPDLKINESVGIFGMGRNVYDRARETAMKYKLPIYDAIHYNTMLDTNTKHLVTNNMGDFKHLKGIYIWSYR